MSDVVQHRSLRRRPMSEDARWRSVVKLMRGADGPTSASPLLVQHSVLVVDDDESTRLLLESILTEAGHHVVCAVDGEDALVRLRGPAPDLMILDLLLPGMSGWDVLEFMEERPRLSTIPIVILTAYGEDEEPPPSRPVIHKPVDADLLCSMVAALLSQNSLAFEEPPSDLFPRARHLGSAPPRSR